MSRRCALVSQFSSDSASTTVWLNRACCSTWLVEAELVMVITLRQSVRTRIRHQDQFRLCPSR